jgi:hypothetical protein
MKIVSHALRGAGRAYDGCDFCSKKEIPVKMNEEGQPGMTSLHAGIESGSKREAVLYVMAEATFLVLFQAEVWSLQRGKSRARIHMERNLK